MCFSFHKNSINYIYKATHSRDISKTVRLRTVSNKTLLTIVFSISLRFQIADVLNIYFLSGEFSIKKIV